MIQPTETTLKDNKFNPFAGPEIEKVIQITQAQEEIWIACVLGGEDANRAYNESISLKLTGKIIFSALEKALNEIVNRHESLRSVFSPDGRFMTVFKNINIPLKHKDLSHFSNEDQNVEIISYIENDAKHIFNLTQGPLFIACLIKISEFEYRLILTAHHIICDGWSMGIMLQELGAVYSSISQNKPVNLKVAESFCDYADEELELIESEKYHNIESFWLNQFKESVPQMTLPTDFPYPKLRNYQCKRLDLSLNQNLLNDLKKVGLESKCGLVTTLLAAFDIFLFKITNQNDIVVGLPSAGQSVTGMTNLIGHCVNLLPLRSKLNNKLSFQDYLKQKNSNLFDAYDHQQLSFGQLLKKLSIPRDPSRVPLVPVMFNIDLGMTDGVAFHDLSYELISNPRVYEIFEIFLNASGTEHDLVFEWSYNKTLFKAETIQQMMFTFEKVIERIVLNPTESISNIIINDYLPDYQDLNNTKTNYPNESLHSLIQNQVQTSSNKIALEFKDTKVSYEALQKQANQIAHYFTKKGLLPGNFVAVSLPRCPELVPVLLAIMQCGAAYIPLDPSYPQSRLEFMLEDSDAKFLVTTSSLTNAFPNEIVKFKIEDVISSIDPNATEPLNISINQESIAYILYTSGSTGKPKGVSVTHKNLVNFLTSMAIEPGITETDRLLSITTISFDIAGLELFLPLLKGATLVLADDETARDGRLLLDILKNKSISMLQATPTTWQMLMDSGWEQPLKLKAICGGEALPLNLSRLILSKCDTLWNVYGPTETTIWSAIKQILPEDTLITIGKPIANTQLYIINEENQLVKPGSIGEIAIAGDGVALGYWKREALTLEKFISDPFSKNQTSKTLYKTGDLGKLLSNGEVQCLGRADQQVKIRGHRIELGEVEQALTLLDDVQSAAIIANENHLVAFVVLNKSIDTTKDLKTQLKNALKVNLPNHLIPQEFNFLDSLPTTLNGKLDRKALTKPERSNNTLPNYTAPRTNPEKIVAEIWEQCLKTEKLDIFSDFFELGGHSLVGVKVMTLIEEKTGKRLPLSSLFEYSTIEKMAQLLNMDNQFITWDSLVAIKPEGNKTPLFIVHGAGMNVMIFNALAKHLPNDQPVYGLQAKGLNGIDEPLGTIEDIASHYIESITKVNPNGPYALAGYSFGGLIAYEMGKQLTEQGKKIKMIAIFDTYLSQNLLKKSFLLKKLIGHYNYLANICFVALNMLKSKEELIQRFKNKKDKFLNKATILKSTKDHKIIQYKNPEKLDKMNAIAYHKYQITPSNLKIDLFRVEKPNHYMHDPEYLGWKDISLGGITIHETPGDHNTLFSPPNDKIIAEHLVKSLNEDH